MNIKRVWALALVCASLICVALLPLALETPEQALARQLSISHEITKSGDLKISWNPDAIQVSHGASLSIGYKYEDKGKIHRFDTHEWDTSLGEAVFRNLSLAEEMKFVWQVKTLAGVEVRKNFSVTLPAPAAPKRLNRQVEKQLTFVSERWETRENSEYMYIEGNDCANFVSQSLAARGIEQTATWNQTKLVPTRPWVSATALNEYLRSTPGVSRLSDGQRDRVKLGDLVFFDWDRSGDSDHVGVVNNIQHEADGSVKLYFAGHTSHKLYRSVDWAIHVLHPNARVEFLSIPETN